MPIILATIDSLLIICGSYDGEEVPKTWVEELLAEKESQADVIGEDVDSLGDRTVRVKIEPEKEKKVETSGGVSPWGEQGPFIGCSGWTA